MVFFKAKLIESIMATKLNRGCFLWSVMSAVLIVRVAESLLKLFITECTVTVLVVHQVLSLFHEPSAERSVTEVQKVVVFNEVNPVIENFMQGFQLTKLTMSLL